MSSQKAVSLLPDFWLIDCPQSQHHSFIFLLLHFLRWPLSFLGFIYSPFSDDSLGDIANIDIFLELGRPIDVSKVSCSGRTLVSPRKRYSHLPHFCKSRIWTYVNLLNLRPQSNSDNSFSYPVIAIIRSRSKSDRLYLQNIFTFSTSIYISMALSHTIAKAY